MSDTAPADRRLAIRFILATIMINMLGVGLAWPVLPKIIQRFEGGEVSDAAFTYAFIAGAFAIAQFIFQPITGALSDRFGRKPVMLIALAGIGADYLLTAFAPSIAWLVVARIVGGVFASTNATANAYMADISTAKDRARNFGLIGAAFGVGFIVGPLLGGFLGEYDLRLPFLVASALASANVIFGLYFLPETLTDENRAGFTLAKANPFGAFARISRLPGIAILALALLLTAIAQRGLEAIWVLYADFRFGWGVKEAAISLAFVGLMFVIVQGTLVGPVVKRLGEQRTVVVGYGLSALVLGLYAIANAGWMVYPLIALHVLGYAVGNTALSSLCSGRTPANAQGVLQGVLASVNSVAIIIGPFVASMVLSAVSRAEPLFPIPGLWFAIGAVLFAIASAISLCVAGTPARVSAE